jgi:hypothetical protein
MSYLWPGVLFEAEAGLFEQLGRHGEIALRITELGVSQVDRQMRQEPLHVLAFPIPGNQANGRKGMSPIPNSA